MLLRLVYLMVTNTFAVLGLLLASDRDKNTEILVLRHQVVVLERQLGGKKVRFTPADRVLLAALLRRLGPKAVGRMRLLVRPDTVLCWHHDLVRKRHAARSRPRRLGRPRTVRSVRALVLRLVRENPGWGYRRVHGELFVLGVKVAPSTVWEILKEAGIDPVGLDYWIWPGQAGALGSSLRDLFGHLPACALPAELPDGSAPG